MNILMVHNFYQQSGGEDQVFRAECALLESRGHSVARFTLHNDQVARMRPWRLAQSTVWNRDVYDAVRALIRRERADVAHFHNTFPLISGGAYYAAGAEGIPIIQTLHNYRMFCVNGAFFRQGRPCKECLGKTIPWRGVLHACYRNSRIASSVAAGMIATYRLLGTWDRNVTTYVVLTQFARKKLIEGGVSDHRIIVKANFVPDPQAGECHTRSRRGALFVGRLHDMKGITTMVDAWRDLDLQLNVIGSGPLDATLRNQGLSTFTLLGQRDHVQVIEAMKTASFLIVPSMCYENFPMVVVEAFACGLPVVASRLGALNEIIDHGVTGLLFEPGNPSDLAAKVMWARDHLGEMRSMGVNARQLYEEHYTPETNYHQLLAIYKKALVAIQNRDPF